MKKKIAAILMFCIVAGCQTGPTWTNHDGDEEVANVAVLTEPTQQDRCIHLIAPDTLSASAEPPAPFELTLMNYLEEQVFIETDGHINLRIVISEPRGAMVKGGWYMVFPDNFHRLKRLHASIYNRDGKRSTCGCATVLINARVTAVDLRPWVGSNAKVSIPVTGYLRSTGRRFHKTVDVDVRIVE
ncbi:MAG: hypothetical protein WD768_05685 [Phycisphaeraceae bacterium]